METPLPAPASIDLSDINTALDAILEPKSPENIRATNHGSEFITLPATREVRELLEGLSYDFEEGDGYIHVLEDIDEQTLEKVLELISDDLLPEEESLSSTTSSFASLEKNVVDKDAFHPKLDADYITRLAKVTQPWRRRAATIFSKFRVDPASIKPGEQPRFQVGTAAISHPVGMTDTVSLAQYHDGSALPLAAPSPVFPKEEPYESTFTAFGAHRFRSSGGMSASTYYSAMSRMSAASGGYSLGQLREEDDYAKLLRSQHLWPVDPAVEQNWSGRGEHVEFSVHEKRQLSDILQVQDLLGSTATAVVQSVKCKRILLARKSIRCNYRFTKDQAIQEVSHIKRLNHAHIVRVIGTYVLGKELSILIYPAAEYNLETFFEAMSESGSGTMRQSCTAFFSCLSFAIIYIHSQLTKHMDIKPKNILVKDETYKSLLDAPWTAYKVYISDFGIARSYDHLEATETDGPTMFTRKYAAPEVVQQDKRGLPADIFSLGCVFLEIMAALGSQRLSDDWISYFSSDGVKNDSPPGISMGKLHALLARNPNGDSSYQSNIDGLQYELSDSGSWTVAWLPRLRATTLPDLVSDMLLEDPGARPTADDLEHQFRPAHDCCTAGSVPLEAASPPDNWKQYQTDKGRREKDFFLGRSSRRIATTRIEEA